MLRHGRARAKTPAALAFSAQDPETGLLVFSFTQWESRIKTSVLVLLFVEIKDDRSV